MSDLQVSLPEPMASEPATNEHDAAVAEAEAEAAVETCKTEADAAEAIAKTAAEAQVETAAIEAAMEKDEVEWHVKLQQQMTEILTKLSAVELSLSIREHSIPEAEPEPEPEPMTEILPEPEPPQSGVVESLVQKIVPRRKRVWI